MDDMTAPVLAFAINRMVAPRLALADFLALAKAAGVAAIEVRNDVAGQEFANGMAAPDLRARIADAGLRLASINALQRFNDWTPDRAREAKDLFRYAAALGAPGIVLCPVVDSHHGWNDRELAAKLRQALKEIRILAADTGVCGYVEPLGMVDSTMRHQSVAAEAIVDVDGAGPLKICYDTFQFYRSRDTELQPALIGLTHVSGISRTDLAPEALTEPDRGFVDGNDITDCIGQVRRLAAAGYRGYVSMEPFDPRIHASADVGAALASSLAWLGERL
jgi:2-keto-myo-inositol isomerase